MLVPAVVVQILGTCLGMSRARLSSDESCSCLCWLSGLYFRRTWRPEGPPMEIAPGVFLNSGRLESLRDPAVLFIESNPDVLEALPHTLGRALPDVTIDGCASAERGLLLMNSGRYHAVVSDMRSAEADDYSLLKGAEALSCPIPLLLSAKGSDAQALKRALGRGAFDVIRNPSREIEASETISRALWFYRLRLTIYHRRQRLNEYRRKKNGRTIRSRNRRTSLRGSQSSGDKSSRRPYRTWSKPISCASVRFGRSIPVSGCWSRFLTNSNCTPETAPSGLCVCWSPNRSSICSRFPRRTLTSCGYCWDKARI